MSYSYVWIFRLALPHSGGFYGREFISESAFFVCVLHWESANLRLPNPGGSGALHYGPLSQQGSEGLSQCSSPALDGVGRSLKDLGPHLIVCSFLLLVRTSRRYCCMVCTLALLCLYTQP